MTVLSDAPAQLIAANGQVAFGRFNDSVADINGRRADYRTPMGKKAPRLKRHFDYKQFQYFGIISDDLLAGCALADTAWMAIAFFYTFTPSTGELKEYTWRSPLGRGLQMSTSPCQGMSRFKHRDVAIEMGYATTPQGRVKTLRVQADGVDLDAELLEGNDYQPMSLCTRTGVNGWVYANKVAGVPVAGQVTIDQQRHDLGTLNACGHHDFSAGYMRRETFWNWACLSSVIDGDQVGFNLSCGVNETSYSENCVWLNNACHAVGGVAFDYDRDDLMQDWRITSQCGAVSLTFTPQGNHKEHLNVGVFASNFNQLFGHFSGTVQLKDGSTLTVKEKPGFVEEQYSKW